MKKSIVFLIAFLNCAALNGMRKHCIAMLPVDYEMDQMLRDRYMPGTSLSVSSTLPNQKSHSESQVITIMERQQKKIDNSPASITVQRQPNSVSPAISEFSLANSSPAPSPEQILSCDSSQRRLATILQHLATPNHP